MTSLSGKETAFTNPGTLGDPCGHPCPLRRTSPLEQERQEVFESVLQAMATTQPDPDCTEACRYVLRHLALGYPRALLSGGGTGRG